VLHFRFESAFFEDVLRRLGPDERNRSNPRVYSALVRVRTLTPFVCAKETHHGSTAFGIELAGADHGRRIERPAVRPGRRGDLRRYQGSRASPCPAHHGRAFPGHLADRRRRGLCAYAPARPGSPMPSVGCMRGGISRRPGPLGTIQTLLATCRLQGVNPYDDLVDLPPRSWKGKFAGATLKSDVSSRGKSSGFERLRQAGAPQPLK